MFVGVMSKRKYKEWFIVGNLAGVSVSLSLASESRYAMFPKLFLEMVMQQDPPQP